MMAIFSCFSTLLVGKKKKSKETPKPADNRKKGSGDSDLRVKPIDLVIPSTGNGLKEPYSTVSKSFPSKEKRSSILPKVLSNDSLARAESVGEAAAYEGSDEHDDIPSVKRDYSDLNLQLKGELASHGSNTDLNTYALDNKMETDERIALEAMVASGHVSDPGMERTAFWGSPVLERSCSNIETKRANKRANRLVKSPKRNSSYSNLQNLTGNGRLEFTYDAHSSPLSVRTSCSADRVMLKRRSSSQVLPSRSRKIWWKLFLWSHRNLHKPRAPQRLASVLSSRNHKDGYVSDTHEPGQKPDNNKKKPLETGNQWVAFSLGYSHMDRVNAWVNSLEDSTSCPIDVEENCDEKEDERTADLHHLEFGESSGKNHSHASRHAAEEVIQANDIIQSLNSFSSVAHISGIGLKVIPSIWAFNSLRSVNLSANYIVHIAPGSLPKSLHTLDLSRNKISTIEGLRDLTKLRVLNLSYNRISRVGHGLSNCTIIKELYLAGNKISDVEGLHRLLKLTVVDLAFNKISTAKALGQLVANYNSLLALNLIGNPIQNNIGDEHLRKAVLSLLPHLAYLNKQPVKPLRVREATKDSVARAALGDALWSSRRRTTRWSIQVSGSSTKSRIGEGSSRGTRHRPMSRHQQSSSRRK